MRELVIVSAAVLGAALLVAAVPGTRSEQERRPDLEKRVEKLEKEVSALKAVVKLQDKKIREFEARFEAVDEWFAQLESAARSMHRGIQEVKDKGFLKAGVNWHAKEALLEHIGSYVDTLKSNVPASGAKNERR